jgi:hypothetical protein
MCRTSHCSAIRCRYSASTACSCRLGCRASLELCDLLARAAVCAQEERTPQPGRGRDTGQARRFRHRLRAARMRCAPVVTLLVPATMVEVLLCTRKSKSVSLVKVWSKCWLAKVPLYVDRCLLRKRFDEAMQKRSRASCRSRPSPFRFFSLSRKRDERLACLVRRLRDAGPAVPRGLPGRRHQLRV